MTILAVIVLIWTTGSFGTEAAPYNSKPPTGHRTDGEIGFDLIVEENEWYGECTVYDSIGNVRSLMPCSDISGRHFLRRPEGCFSTGFDKTTSSKAEGEKTVSFNGLIYSEDVLQRCAASGPIYITFDDETKICYYVWGEAWFMMRTYTSLERCRIANRKKIAAVKQMPESTTTTATSITSSFAGSPGTAITTEDSSVFRLDCERFGCQIINSACPANSAVCSDIDMDKLITMTRDGTDIAVECGFVSCEIVREPCSGVKCEPLNLGAAVYVVQEARVAYRARTIFTTTHKPTEVSTIATKHYTQDSSTLMTTTAPRTVKLVMPETCKLKRGPLSGQCVSVEKLSDNLNDLPVPLLYERSTKTSAASNPDALFQWISKVIEAAGESPFLNGVVELAIRHGVARDACEHLTEHLIVKDDDLRKSLISKSC